MGLEPKKKKKKRKENKKQREISIHIIDDRQRRTRTVSYDITLEGFRPAGSHKKWSPF